MLKLIIIRGIPGSGKTTIANEIKKNLPMSHFEADDFFYLETGKYNFDPSKIKEAHAWCQKNVREALLNNQSVIVSNTFVKLWEMKYYIDLAKETGASLKVLRCTKEYKNIHGVPDEIVERMKSTFEDYEGEEVVD
mgnify:CR=1 FL=1